MIQIQLRYPLAVVAFLFCINSHCVADDWAQFRGSGGMSASDAKLPTQFDDQTNVAWKIALPAKGASSPIVVGDRVIVTCSGGNNQDELYTVCYDAKSGKEKWTQRFWATGRCFVHSLSANAAPTPVSDGKHVYAFYSSNDLACMDLEGNLIWYRGLAVDFPKAGNDVGMSSSPVVHDGVVVVQVECQGDSFAMGLDAATGKTIWTRERDRKAIWSSPLVVKVGDRAFVTLQSLDSFDVLDLKSGELVYQADGQVSSISSPAMVGAKLYAPVNGTTAYAVTADGTLQQEWNNAQLRPSSMSAVVNDGKIYSFNRAGGLFVYDANDGSELGKTRVVKGGMWATPVIAGQHMYMFSQNGNAYVVDISNPKKLKVVHETSFQDEVILGSPAVADNAMYFRSDRFLWKIAK